MEKTLVLIKPDAVEKNIIGKIISMYEENDLVVGQCKTILTNKEILEKHYEEHIGKDFFEDLIDFMINKRVFALIIEGKDAVNKVRKINGLTDPNKAERGTIRKLYGTSITQNAVHGSASLEDAKREIKIWFGDKYE